MFQVATEEVRNMYRYNTTSFNHTINISTIVNPWKEEEISKEIEESQTFKRVGKYLDFPVLSHAQLATYVLLFLEQSRWQQ